MSRSIRRISAILDVENYKPKVDKYWSACVISFQHKTFYGLPKTALQQNKLLHNVERTFKYPWRLQRYIEYTIIPHYVDDYIYIVCSVWRQKILTCTRILSNTATAIWFSSIQFRREPVIKCILMLTYNNMIITAQHS